MERSLKIAVAGKGGVGKTLVAGVLAEFFAKKGFTVLAIDADPTPNLALTLGLSVEEANKIVPISENTPLIESKTQSSIPGVYNLAFSVEDIVEQFSVKTPYNVNLLIMGTVRSAGAGCMCPANTVIRALLHHLIVKRKEAVVTDMEAGLEHMGRGTAEHVEIMLVVSDSSRKSLEAARRIVEMARQVGVKECFIVGNRITGQLESNNIESFSKAHGIQTLGMIPFDEKVREADMKGQTPLKHADGSEAIEAIRKVGEQLLRT